MGGGGGGGDTLAGQEIRGRPPLYKTLPSLPPIHVWYHLFYIGVKYNNYRVCSYNIFSDAAYFLPVVGITYSCMFTVLLGATFFRAMAIATDLPMVLTPQPRLPIGQQQKE